jgi:hypothetical protein
VKFKEVGGCKFVMDFVDPMFENLFAYFGHAQGFLYCKNKWVAGMDFIIALWILFND